MVFSVQTFEDRVFKHVPSDPGSEFLNSESKHGLSLFLQFHTNSLKLS